LNLTPKNLSEILKNETGLSAKQVIEEFLMFEAKSLLKQTQMSIKEIVYWLGYEDASYFTKHFKNKEGITPLNYRNQ
jgi:AraC family transcriptional regulator, transcriptional activator of pobA